MAFQGKGILGTPNGKIGQLVFKTVNGKGVVSSSPSYPGRQIPPEFKYNCTKFPCVCDIHDIINDDFLFYTYNPYHPVPGYVTNWIEDNQSICKFLEFSDPRDMIVSKGVLEPLVIEVVAYSGFNDSLYVQYSAKSGGLGGNGPDDLSFLLYMPERPEGQQWKFYINQSLRHGFAFYTYLYVGDPPGLTYLYAVCENSILGTVSNSTQRTYDP